MIGFIIMNYFKIRYGLPLIYSYSKGNDNYKYLDEILLKNMPEYAMMVLLRLIQFIFIGNFYLPMFFFEKRKDFPASKKQGHF